MTVHPVDKKLFERDNFIILSKACIAASWAFLLFTCGMWLASPSVFYKITDYCLDWMYP